MKNLTFKAAMLNDSRTTVNRQSTDGQSQRHYKQTPLTKRWKVLMTLVFLFTFAIGNVWGADITIAQPANPQSSSNNISYGLVTVSHNNNAVYSNGAIKAANHEDEFTITFATTKSDMYIKSVEFAAVSDGSLTSDDGTFSEKVFNTTGNKTSVAIKMKSNQGKKGSAKLKNVVVNPGSNDVEVITFDSYVSSNKSFTFTSSAATSAITSITSNNSNSVSSNILSWSNQRTLVFASSRKIKFIAFLLNDAKMYTGFSVQDDNGTYSDNYTWVGKSDEISFYNGTRGGRSIKNVYVVLEPATYTVTFDANGHGTAPDAIGNLSSGAKPSKPTDPSETGWIFGGWYNKADWSATGAEAWTWGTSAVTKDTTLYAK
ncbi:MAG: InlB B-repeat-containing protein, partial [Paludibacteraceae bacterium]|nr:InlB B-repeat-containing protein [Paludibacteraceae bacterium]